MNYYYKILIFLLFLIVLNSITIVKSNLLGDINYNASADVIWNFDEIDKLLLGGSHNDTSKKSFGKVICIFHNLKNQTELSVEFKLNNKLVYIYQRNLLKADNGDSNGAYVTMDDNDQKILLAIFNELKSPKPTPTNQIRVNTKDSYFTAHFIGDINSELFKKIDKVITWNPITTKVKECDSLQKLFIKYSKKI
ncbi:hypothetical protein DDB_G0289459 [Dictyostelium discoideum AX4]|uniref:Uncharacterized protein n=1 Tax=Dictyostelium discoideum TaxID=44689 RepID=Q54HH4_DICDI|nr:hypothetical protein DDB_G0289459 [Dictyostelium discoideum AX4]EAL62709.1 hypothetical protein DDB_G0289459 [Dictyostelium discoideum AX4]|eukprot:XP_636211.1 hypothetical protein DDB_G0289459 [Dictyostelium discoideum AX4]